MRISNLLGAVLITALTGVVEAAPPVFNSQQAAPAKSKTSWSMPSMKRLLFGKQDAAKPTAGQSRSGHPIQVSNAATPPVQPPTAQQLASQQVAPQQSISNTPSAFSAQGIKSALSRNPLAGVMASKEQSSKETTPSDDAFLRNEGPINLTADLLLPMAALAEQSGNVEAARKHYQKAVANDPTNTKVLRQYGRLEDRQGRLEEAEKLYAQAVAADPRDSASLNDLGLCYARQNKLQESVATLSQAIALRPEKPLYRNNIAKVLVELGDTQSAAAQLTAAHGPVVAQYNLGTLLAASGKNAGAVAAMQQAVAMDPNFEPARVALNRLRPTGQPAAAAPQVASRHNLPTLATPSPAATSPAAPVAREEALPSLPGAAPPAIAGPAFPRMLPPTVGRE